MSFERSDIRVTANALRAALAKLNRRLRTQGEPGEIGATGLSLLGRLFVGGSSTATALAEQECLQLQSLTHTLRTLEGMGLITRATDEADRRSSIIAITQAGIEILKQSAHSRTAWLANVMSSELSEIEREVLRLASALMERMADAKK